MPEKRARSVSPEPTQPRKRAKSAEPETKPCKGSRTPSPAPDPQRARSAESVHAVVDQVVTACLQEPIFQQLVREVAQTPTDPDNPNGPTGRAR